MAHVIHDPVRCGLNGDWCVDAWWFGGPTPAGAREAQGPNRTDGDVYVIDNEDADGSYSVVRRWYRDDENDVVDTLFEGSKDRCFDFARAYARYAPIERPASPAGQRGLLENYFATSAGLTGLTDLEPGTYPGTEREDGMTVSGLTGCIDPEPGTYPATEREDAMTVAPGGWIEAWVLNWVGNDGVVVVNGWVRAITDTVIWSAVAAWRTEVAARDPEAWRREWPRESR